MKRIFSVLILIFIFQIALLLSGHNLYSQNTDQNTPGADADTLQKRFRLFENDTMLNISIRFDLTTYLKNKPKNDYLKADLTFNPGSSDSLTGDVRLKTRGIFRNKYCQFAPIELNFRKADFGYSDLDSINKLKLVVQCSSGKDKEEYIFKEYLSYKLFNIITDTSLRVRLVTINYIDSKKNRKPVRHYGFFIEPVEMLAARKNCRHIKFKSISQRSIFPEIMDRMAIFNYMIGNYDWSIPGEHNVLILKSIRDEPYGMGIAVPHDFDWTGLVNASYAIPTESIGVKNVRERIFEGICRNKDAYNKQLDILEKRKGDFYQLINGFPYISKKVKKDITGYLDEFFNQLTGSRTIIIRSFNSTCKHL